MTKKTPAAATEWTSVDEDLDIPDLDLADDDSDDEDEDEDGAPVSRSALRLDDIVVDEDSDDGDSLDDTDDDEEDIEDGPKDSEDVQRDINTRIRALELSIDSMRDSGLVAQAENGEKTTTSILKRAEAFADFLMDLEPEDKEAEVSPDPETP